MHQPIERSKSLCVRDPSTMTLRNVSNFTLVEIADEVLRRLKKQNAFSHDQARGCRYRGRNGTACAVGLLIPDADYHSDLESFGARSLLEKFQPVEKQGVFTEQANMLCALQQFHDMAASMSSTTQLSMKERFEKILPTHELRSGLAFQVVVERFKIIFAD